MLAGDFNTWWGPTEPALNILRSAFPQTPRTVKTETWRGPLGLHAQLDYMFIRGPLAPSVVTPAFEPVRLGPLSRCSRSSALAISRQRDVTGPSDVVASWWVGGGSENATRTNWRIHPSLTRLRSTAAWR